MSVKLLVNTVIQVLVGKIGKIQFQMSFSYIFFITIRTVNRGMGELTLGRNPEFLSQPFLSAFHHFKVFSGGGTEMETVFDPHLLLTVHKSMWEKSKSRPNKYRKRHYLQNILSRDS